jgi:thioredoxin reductase
MTSTVLFDLAVVGAGPAGLSAAVAAAEQGRRVVLVDTGARPGGQFWRHSPTGVSRGQHGRQASLRLRNRLSLLTGAGRVTYLPGRRVWFVERPAAAGEAFGLRLTPVDGVPAGGPAHVRARALILCPGAHDRQLPVPGWDLPGVMAAGGVQALLKEHGTLAGRRAVVAGTGPFLLPVAAALSRAGAVVAAVCEANTPSGWLRTPLGAAAVPGKAVEAAGYALAFARQRIPYRPRTAVTAIQGDERVSSVTLSRLDDLGRVRSSAGTLDVDLVALGWGFTPALELVTAVGAETVLAVDGSLVARVDDDQRSTVPGVYVAGEATGVGGASLAAAEGELAGLVAAAEGGAGTAGPRAGRLRGTIGRSRAFALAMHRAHPVPPCWHEWLTDGTTVCRCEEVTAGEVRAACTELGAADARMLKLLARPGMGWCQGRICGFAAAHLAAAHAGREVTAADLRATAKQSLCAPVTLAELAEAD